MNSATGSIGFLKAMWCLGLGKPFGAIYINAEGDVEADAEGQAGE